MTVFVLYRETHDEDNTSNIVAVFSEETAAEKTAKVLTAEDHRDCYGSTWYYSVKEVPSFKSSRAALRGLVRGPQASRPGRWYL